MSDRRGLGRYLSWYFRTLFDFPTRRPYPATHYMPPEVEHLADCGQYADGAFCNPRCPVSASPGEQSTP